MDRSDSSLPRASVVDDFIPEGTVLLEGAQGVLLDEDVGFHPHTTWSRCGFVEAENWLASVGRHAKRLGVLRAYATRHGAGPFPSATTLGATSHTTTLSVGKARFESATSTRCSRATRCVRSVASTGWCSRTSIALRLAACRATRASSRRSCRPTSSMRARADRSARDGVCGARGRLVHPEAMAEALGVKLAITSYGPRAEDKRFVDAKI
ncbi:MAG: adenylosuccinate synthetase [Sandaracinus sp.]|nr:adenylosuccinate synthetase [Sandaracinus sp.]